VKGKEGGREGRKEREWKEEWEGKEKMEGEEGKDANFPSKNS
jgi:hypothetical protein